MTRKERKQLEQKALDIIAESMQYNGMQPQALEEVKQASNSDLIAFIESMEG